MARGPQEALAAQTRSQGLASAEMTITPGPSLNLVLGPNGSGKSSFVCALCVGLGGSTKLLGRADNLASFVRRNCNKAWTEITLSGGAGQPDIVIRRDISITYSRGEDGRPKQGYEAQFQINGRCRTLRHLITYQLLCLAS
ncbi:SMC_N domain-containing protein, partial [Haematococcus lacustris]